MGWHLGSRIQDSDPGGFKTLRSKVPGLGLALTA